ncbi:MAG: hypothetical protein ACOYM3_30480 [Terrimicrobiaceae bacterium]
MKIPGRPRHPNDARRHPTKLSRTQEGLDDLRFSLEHATDKTPAHRALADTCLALGMKNLAWEHLRLSNPAAAPTPEPTHDEGTGNKAD